MMKVFKSMRVLNKRKMIKGNKRKQKTNKKDNNPFQNKNSKLSKKVKEDLQTKKF